MSERERESMCVCVCVRECVKERDSEGVCAYNRALLGTAPHFCEAVVLKYVKSGCFERFGVGDPLLSGWISYEKRIELVVKFTTRIIQYYWPRTCCVVNFIARKF